MTTQDTENQAGGAEPVEETVNGGESTESGAEESTEEKTESESDEAKTEETEAA